MTTKYNFNDLIKPFIVLVWILVQFLVFFHCDEKAQIKCLIAHPFLDGCMGISLMVLYTTDKRI
jgi:hypothetical protein